MRLFVGDSGQSLRNRLFFVVSWGMRLPLLLILSVITLGAKDFSLQIEGVEQEILVSVPKNHDVSQNWPAIFYYHGTNGSPHVRLMRSHAGEDDWIVVGMSYVQRGAFQLTPDGMAAEMRVLNEVRAQLKEKINLDQARVYVSGFSKGGWMSDLLLQKDRSLAGGAILGAGHLHQVEESVLPFSEKIPIFIGVGRHDGNYPFGLNAVLFFRKLGADPVMEAWPSLGHSMPRGGSRGLKEWLALQLGEKPDAASLARELEEVLAIESDFERWWELLAFSERPFVKVTEGWVEKAEARRLEVEKEPSLTREVRILKESRRLLGKELTKKTLQDFEAIAAGYARIVEHAGDSPQREIAQKDYERFGEILDLAQAQFAKQRQDQERREVEVKPETERRRIPRNPLVR